jgi:protein TonB
LLDSEHRRFRLATAAEGNLPPDYPPEAGARGEHGLVGLRLHVDRFGRVARVEVMKSSGSRVLDDAARTRLAGWRFIPALRDGRPVPDIVELNINFELD